ncbi:MAG TPA: hypothetical protein VFZ86_09010 [Thermoleophilia bacterium]|nr:hypothetical protein [Thermoleophilia bacterium]
MPSPDALSGPSAEGRRLSSTGGGSLLPLAGCVPVPGPRRRPVTAVAVDDELVWVTAVPALELGTARAPSPAAFVHLCVQLAAALAAAGGPALEAALSDADLVDAAARAVAGYLDDLPDLPLVGEPFGGEEGTD